MLQRRGGAALLRVVANALVLTTGVDVPSVDMILFADAKRSHVDILQAMGRAARASPGKTAGYVLVPVSAKVLASGAGDGAAGALGSLIDVMGAFVAADEELRESLARMVGEASRRGVRPGLDGWPEELRRRFKLEDATVVSGGGAAVAALLDQVYTISCGLVPLWEQRCGLLARFREREGNADVPAEHVEDGVRRGGWLTTQRQAFKAGTLGSARQERLEALGVKWRIARA